MRQALAVAESGEAALEALRVVVADAESADDEDLLALELDAATVGVAYLSHVVRPHARARHARF